MTTMRSMGAARRAGALFRRRLTSRSDVKGASRPGRSQNRAVMCGGRA
jgi:hypothetical protein